MSKQREEFEKALDAIGGTIHVFSAARAFTQPRYLEGVTEVCWRTWQAAWQASRAAALEEAAALCELARAQSLQAVEQLGAEEGHEACAAIGGAQQAAKLRDALIALKEQS